MSGAQYNYIRVPTASNDIGFGANDLPDYGDYNGSLQRSLSGYSDDTTSFGSPTYEVSPSLDNFDFEFSSPHYGHHQVSAPRSTATTTSRPHTTRWTDTTIPGYKNTLSSPQVVTGSFNIQPSSIMSTPSPEYVCLYDGCRQKAFRRSADLDRHIKHVHLKPPDTYFCDYNRCPRSEKAVAAATNSTSQPLETIATASSSSGAGIGAFGRKDHCRAHYRDYHREDLCRRNGKEAAGWFDDRNISSSWWRCTKCLRKVSYSRCGWECRDCGQTLEPERINARKRRMGKGSSLSSSSSSRAY
ncbi:hypothetical protein J7T55_014633 [Diaporthe amygdali]|uniref:uncharacterized protein n=1 Tax=Phomopsis amygdali TaxID=1214568 RepID=UPI0022FEAF6C|nr:uncharacterized protein J7T55_014633 [Diaporthe amygdali]KAJ0107105.1 hypothetical protein J7T55_014633 [Diaporthe amygdali]